MRIAVVVGLILAGASGCGDDPRGPAPVGASSVGAGGGGPSAACPPGSWTSPEGDGSCWEAGLPPGWSPPPLPTPQAGIDPASCGPGFSGDGRAGCEPILPALPCAKRMMAPPGETICREVAPCGSGTWGDAPVDAETQYVDSSYLGGDGDGSAAKPWTTVQAGVDAAVPGAIVAIAAGIYVEDVAVAGKAVRLWGRCPKLVGIVGSTDAAAVAIEDAAGSEVRDLAVTGAHLGVRIDASSGCVLDRVWIHDTGYLAVAEVATTAPGVALTRSLVETVTSVGLYTEAGAIVEGCEIRDVLADPLDGAGFGVLGYQVPAPGELIVRGTLVDGARSSGIATVDTTVRIESTAVRDTLPNALRPGIGTGILVSGPLGGVATIRTTTVSRSAFLGVAFRGVDGDLEAVTITDTPPSADDATGWGLVANFDPDTRAPCSVEVRASTIAGSHGVGAGARSASMVLDGVLVRDSAVRQDRAIGIYVDLTPADAPRGSMKVTGSIVEHVAGSGVEAFDSDLVVDGSLVRGVTEALGKKGAGVVLASTVGGAATAVVSGSRIEDIDGDGFVLDGGTTDIDSTHVTGIRLGQSRSGGEGVHAQLGPDATPAKVRITRSIIELTEGPAVVVGGSDIEIESTRVGPTTPLPGAFGDGVYAAHGMGRRASVVMRWSSIEGAHNNGVLVIGSDAALEGVAVVDVGPESTAALSGFGLTVSAKGLRPTPAELEARGCRVERARTSGVLVDGAIATLQGLLVADVLPDAKTKKFGRGMSIQQGGTLALADSLVTRCRDVGVLFLDATGSIHDTTVSHTAPREADGLLGDGIDVVRVPEGGNVELRRTNVEESARVGVGSFGGAVSLEGCTLECNPVHLDAETFGGTNGSFDDLGRNVCGCGSAPATCAVSHTSVEPPDPLDP